MKSMGKGRTMRIAGWVLGIVIIVIGLWLWRYPSRYGRGFVQALSMVIVLGGLYIIWAANLLAGHTVLTHSLF